MPVAVNALRVKQRRHINPHMRDKQVVEQQHPRQRSKQVAQRRSQRNQPIQQHRKGGKNRTNDAYKKCIPKPPWALEQIREGKAASVKVHDVNGDFVECDHDQQHQQRKPLWVHVGGERKWIRLAPQRSGRPIGAE